MLSMTLHDSVIATYTDLRVHAVIDQEQLPWPHQQCIVAEGQRLPVPTVLCCAVCAIWQPVWRPKVYRLCAVEACKTRTAFERSKISKQHECRDLMPITDTTACWLEAA